MIEYLRHIDGRRRAHSRSPEVTCCRQHLDRRLGGSAFVPHAGSLHSSLMAIVKVQNTL